MNLKSKTLKEIKKFLARRNYRPKTISSYTAALKHLFDYYSDIRPRDINFSQLDSFTHYLLKRKKLSSSSVRQSLSAFELYYNKLLGSEFDINSLKPPPSSRKIPVVITPEEIRKLLLALELNTIQYIMISLIYSAGLSLSQAINLKIKDIDIDKKIIVVRGSDNKVIRRALLADHLVERIRNYTKFQDPSVSLFSHKATGKPYSKSSIYKALKKSLLSANIKKEVTFRDLKTAYIKHMELYGTPLPIILRELGIFGAESFFTYSQIGLKKESVSFSPLDRVLHDNNVKKFDTTSIEKSYSLIQDENEKSYLLESIKCLNAMAPRATIILAWNAAIRNIQNKCLNVGINSLNSAIKKHNPRAPKISTIYDFEKIKERLVIEASHTLNIYSKHEKDILVMCLGIRNKCGHPGTFIPQEHRVASFLEDLFNIVFSQRNSKIDTRTRALEYDDGLPF